MVQSDSEMQCVRLLNHHVVAARPHTGNCVSCLVAVRCLWHSKQAEATANVTQSIADSRIE